MTETIIVLCLIAVIIAGILAGPVWVQQRRSRLRQKPLPALWQASLEYCLPIYTRLSLTERRRLQGHIQVFLAEKQFIGCRGVQVTPEMKLAIAAVACLLLLNERGKYFPKLRSILVYPSAYIVQETTVTAGYVVSEKRVARLGESWSRDQVVLSWEQIQFDQQHWQDGHNVILHEFAHQLDQEDSQAAGVPVLAHPRDYSVWAAVMTEAYQQLCQEVDRANKTVLDAYGATNPAEFFAVATETFFEKPRQLHQQHRALYEQLQRFYQLDPLQW